MLRSFQLFKARFVFLPNPGDIGGATFGQFGVVFPCSSGLLQSGELLTPENFLFQNIDHKFSPVPMTGRILSILAATLGGMAMTGSRVPHGLCFSGCHNAIHSG